MSTLIPQPTPSEPLTKPKQAKITDHIKILSGAFPAQWVPLYPPLIEGTASIDAEKILFVKKLLEATTSLAGIHIAILTNTPLVENTLIAQIQNNSLQYTRISDISKDPKEKGQGILVYNRPTSQSSNNLQPEMKTDIIILWDGLRLTTPMVFSKFHGKTKPKPSILRLVALGTEKELREREEDHPRWRAVPDYFRKLKNWKRPLSYSVTQVSVGRLVRQIIKWVKAGPKNEFVVRFSDLFPTIQDAPNRSDRTTIQSRICLPNGLTISSEMARGSIRPIEQAEQAPRDHFSVSKPKAQTNDSIQDAILDKDTELNIPNDPLPTPSINSMVPLPISLETQIEDMMQSAQPVLPVVPTVLPQTIFAETTTQNVSEDLLSTVHEPTKEPTKEPNLSRESPLNDGDADGDADSDMLISESSRESSVHSTLPNLHGSSLHEPQETPYGPKTDKPTPGAQQTQNPELPNHVIKHIQKCFDYPIFTFNLNPLARHHLHHDLLDPNDFHRAAVTRAGISRSRRTTPGSDDESSYYSASESEPYPIPSSTVDETFQEEVADAIKDILPGLEELRLSFEEEQKKVLDHLKIVYNQKMKTLKEEYEAKAKDLFSTSGPL
ncbi:hypothetical protein CLU79DRAFT_743478 [Phycomyces nitens]|nr:hypothetical protein CLU79DRAFT_743478 [Phycomyces nitens]